MALLFRPCGHRVLGLYPSIWPFQGQRIQHQDPGRRWASFHRRPLKVKPTQNQDGVADFDPREHLKDLGLNRKRLKKLMEEGHGYLNDDQESVATEKKNSISYELFLRQNELPKLKRVHAWDKKELKRVKKLFGWDSEASVIVLESKRLINEAIHLGINPQFVATSRISLLQDLSLVSVTNKDAIEMLLVPYKDICALSNLTTSPGFLCVFRQTDVEKAAKNPRVATSLPLTLILDNIRNPDNLGGILRVAAAAGCQKVIAMKGCVNAWQPKVVRAACGAHFHVPILAKQEWSEVQRQHSESSTVFLANMDSSSKVSDAKTVYEERTDVAELLKECERHRCVDSNTGEPIDTSFEDPELLERFSNVSLESMAYSDVKCSGGEMVMVIGGETEGISQNAHKFAVQNNGKQVHVPLLNSVESINVMSVVSIILFHMQSNLMDKTK